jgi:hypothetical protein
MSQKRMAELFGVDTRTINYHLGKIYESGELTKEATIRKIGIVQTEGKRDVERSPLFYNLDAIIAVGYRVNSYQATHVHPNLEQKKRCIDKMTRSLDKL